MTLFHERTLAHSKSVVIRLGSLDNSTRLDKYIFTFLSHGIRVSVMTLIKLKVNEYDIKTRIF